MSVQYISDDQGKTTGVFIPIQDWNKLKNKFIYKSNTTPVINSYPAWDKKWTIGH